MLETGAAWLLALLWILPLLYAVWTAFHPPEFSARFTPVAPLTLENFSRAWAAAPFARYFLNTFMLVTLILGCQLVLCTLAAYAFARYAFPGSGIAFALVLAQLMIMPDVLIVENYKTMNKLGILDSIPAIALPYVASAFGVFLLRQTFKTVPKELDDAARVEGAGSLQTLLKVYVPLAKPVYLAYGLVSVSYHWNNFLWPLIVTSSVEFPAIDRWPAGLLFHRSGHRLVDHLRRDALDLRAAAHRLPALPTAVCAKLHACRNSLISGDSTDPVHWGASIDAVAIAPVPSACARSANRINRQHGAACHVRPQFTEALYNTDGCVPAH